jgi:hypothetical protein
MKKLAFAATVTVLVGTAAVVTLATTHAAYADPTGNGN